MRCAASCTSSIDQTSRPLGISDLQRFQHCRAAPNCRVPAGVRQIRSLPGGTRHQSIVLPCGVSNFGVSNFGLAMRDDGASNHAKVEDASGNNGSPGIDLSGVRPAPEGHPSHRFMWHVYTSVFTISGGDTRIYGMQNCSARSCAQKGQRCSIPQERSHACERREGARGPGEASEASC